MINNNTSAYHHHSLMYVANTAATLSTLAHMVAGAFRSLSLIYSAISHQNVMGNASNIKSHILKWSLPVGVSSFIMTTVQQEKEHFLLDVSLLIGITTLNALGMYEIIVLDGRWFDWLLPAKPLPLPVRALRIWGAHPHSRTFIPSIFNRLVEVLEELKEGQFKDPITLTNCGPSDQLVVTFHVKGSVLLFNIYLQDSIMLCLHHQVRANNEVRRDERALQDPVGRYPLGDKAQFILPLTFFIRAILMLSPNTPSGLEVRRILDELEQI